MSSLGPTYKAVQSQTQQVAPQEVPRAINALTSSPAPDSQFPQAAGGVGVPRKYRASFNVLLLRITCDLC